MRNIIKTTILLSFLALASCSSTDIPQQDQIVGKWYLKEFYNNNVLESLDECSLQKSIEFKSSGYYNEEYYIKDTITNMCKFNGTLDGKWSYENNKYTLDPTSLFDQKQKIALNKNELIYTFEGWRFVGNQITTSQIVSIYRK